MSVDPRVAAAAPIEARAERAMKDAVRRADTVERWAVRMMFSCHYLWYRSVPLTESYGTARYLVKRYRLIRSEGGANGPQYGLIRDVTLPSEWGRYHPGAFDDRP